MWFPVVVVKNVYIFPGVPEILQRKFSKIRELFREAPYHLVEVYLQADEGQIARILHFVLEKFPDLQLGSYPYFTRPDYSIKLTLESKDTAYLASAHSLLLSELSRIDLRRCSRHERSDTSHLAGPEGPGRGKTESANRTFDRRHCSETVDQFTNPSARHQSDARWGSRWAREGSSSVTYRPIAIDGLKVTR
jgi:hypothetical protein